MLEWRRLPMDAVHSGGMKMVGHSNQARLPPLKNPINLALMAKKKIDTRAIGLEVGTGLAKWVTGAENLHYGLWDGLEVNAGNLGAAQAAYTDKLFGFLPEGPLSILDIGGGAGETARKLLALGHEVNIVIPSDFLANRCRANAPGARVHETTFEDFETNERFDVCLFSESFQYVPLQTALSKAMELTKPGGHILIADCFRSEDMRSEGGIRAAGGGHPVARFREEVSGLPLEQLALEDITESVAPSIDLEQALFHVFGTALDRADAELSLKRPKTRRVLGHVLRLFLKERGVRRLNARLRENFRTSEAFVRNNRYLITLLKKAG